MDEFITAAKNNNVAVVKKMLRGRSNSELWLAAEEAYKAGHYKLLNVILKEKGEDALVEFKSRDFIEAIKEGNKTKYEKLFSDPDMDPAAFENSAIKTAFRLKKMDIVFELMELATVREQLFADCKENLTLDEVKFLLYAFSEKIEDAKFLYEQFIDEEVDDEFEASGEESEEDSFNGSSEDEDEADEESDEDELPEPSFSAPKGKRQIKQVDRNMNYESDEEESSEIEIKNEKNKVFKMNDLNEKVIKLYKSGITNKNFPELKNIVDKLVDHIPPEIEQRIISIMLSDDEYADLMLDKYKNVAETKKAIISGLRKMLKLISFEDNVLRGEISWIFSKTGINWNKLPINDSDFRSFLAENMGLI